MSSIVTRTFAADHVTPVRAYAALRSHAPQRSSFLFESVHPGERWGRYSIIGYRVQTESLYAAGHDALTELAADIAALDQSGSTTRVGRSPFADTESLAARLTRSLELPSGSPTGKRSPSMCLMMPGPKSSVAG